MQNISSWVDANGGLPKAAQAQNSAFIGSFALAGGYEQGKFDGYMSSWLNATLDDALRTLSGHLARAVSIGSCWEILLDSVKPA